MNKRRLGSSELYLTEIGFGAWAVGGGGYAFGWGKQDDNESIGAVRRALEAGVNWIDTAPVYGLGHSEEVVAKALEGWQGEALIATKCSLVWNDQGQVSDNLRSDSILRECEASLKRLNTDVIDLYQIHWPSDDERIEEGWEAVGRLIEAGKVRYGGVSNFNVKQMARAQALRPITSLQPPYSMLRRAVEEEILPYCSQNNIGVVAYSPMQSGLLTGRFDISKLDSNDWRPRTGEFREPNLSVNLEFAKDLKPIAEKYGRTVAQLAIAWTLRRGEVASAIVGARRSSQVDEIIGGTGWQPDESDLAEIDNLLLKRREKLQALGGMLR